MDQEALPRRLWLARAERGLTLRQAAKVTGVSRETLNELEHGRREPHPPTVFKIAQGYGVPVHVLLGEEPLLVPKSEAPYPPTPSEEALSDEERRGQIIRDFLSYEEEPFGELPAEERIKRLKRWCEHFETLRNRRRLDRDNLIDRGELDYGRAMEMYALDEVDRKRYFAEGVHTHTERVIRGELEVSEEEWELCWRVNNAMGDAQNLTKEVRELVEGSGGPLERQHMGQNLKFFLEEDVSRAVSKESGSAALGQES